MDDRVSVSEEFGEHLATMLRYTLSLQILDSAERLRTADKYGSWAYGIGISNLLISYIEKAARVFEGTDEEEIGYEFVVHWGEEAEEVVEHARRVKADTERRWAREIALPLPLGEAVRVLNENSHVRRLGEGLTVEEVAQLYHADHDDPARKELMRIVPLSDEELGKKVGDWERGDDGSSAD